MSTFRVPTLTGQHNARASANQLLGKGPLLGDPRELSSHGQRQIRLRMPGALQPLCHEVRANVPIIQFCFRRKFKCYFQNQLNRLRKSINKKAGQYF